MPKAQATPNQTPVIAPKVRSYSVGDLQLKKYIELDMEVKAITKERDDLKDILKHKGTHATNNFVCTVDTRTRTNPPSLKALVETYGPGVKDICTVSEFEVVKVSAKGGAE